MTLALIIVLAQFVLIAYLAAELRDAGQRLSAARSMIAKQQVELTEATRVPPGLCSSQAPSLVGEPDLHCRLLDGHAGDHITDNGARWRYTY